MAESSWPAAAPTVVTEHDFERLMCGWFGSGLVGDGSEDLLVFADSTGMQVKIRAERYARVRGFVWHSGDSIVTVPIADNTSGSTRIDRIVLELDRSTWTVRVQVVQGTPGSGEPSITQDEGDTGVWQLWVASVTVGDGAATINAADVSNRDMLLGPQLLIADGGNLPDANVPRQFFRFRPDDQELWFHTQGASSAGRRLLWSDSGWVNLTGENSFWRYTFNSSVRKVGPMVQLRLATAERIGGNLPAGADSRLPGSIPEHMRPVGRNVEIVARTTGNDAANLVVRYENHDNAGQIRMQSHPGFSNGQHLMSQTVAWLVP